MGTISLSTTDGAGLAVIACLLLLVIALLVRGRKRAYKAGDGHPPPAHFYGHKWCPLCKSALEVREVCERPRQACSNKSCNFVLWDSPKPCCLGVAEYKGGIVLVRRKIPPAVGSWCLPGGFMEAEESPQEATEREFFEETGLIVKAERILGAYSPCHGVNEVIIVYLVKVVGGELKAGWEEMEVGSFSESELPTNIAFDQHRRIISDWLHHKSVDNQGLQCPDKRG